MRDRGENRDLGGSIEVRMVPQNSGCAKKTGSVEGPRRSPDSIEECRTRGLKNVGRGGLGWINRPERDLDRTKAERHRGAVIRIANRSIEDREPIFLGLDIASDAPEHADQSRGGQYQHDRLSSITRKAETAPTRASPRHRPDAQNRRVAGVEQQLGKLIIQVQ